MLERTDSSLLAASLPPPEFAIETRDLTKQFDHQIAVNSIDLKISPGEVYGLIGPNGAGKTTLIRMLAAAEEPTTGEIYIHGERLLRDRQNATIKRYLGYLPDDYPLYEDLTVWDYLDYYARLYELRDPKRTQRLHEVLELVQLTYKRNSPITELSRGMKQRLGLARTIVHEPILLLLDEPVSGLDPIARRQFREVIQTLQEAGMTILISSHVLSDLAELCTSIGIVELGCLVESTSLENLYQRLSHQQILIKLSDGFERLVEVLSCTLHVESWTPSPDRRSVMVNFSGSVEDCTALLRSLIVADIPISEFHRTQESLEDIFLKLGHKQVS